VPIAKNASNAFWDVRMGVGKMDGAAIDGWQARKWEKWCITKMAIAPVTTAPTWNV